MIGLPSNHESIKRFNPNLDPDTLRAKLDQTEANCRAAGYDYVNFLPEPEEAIARLSKELELEHWDGVIFGWGIRGNPEMTVLFEELVDCVRTMSPGTKIMFNTSPDSTLDAAKRSFPLPK